MSWSVDQARGAPAVPSPFIGAPPHEIVYDYSYDGTLRSLDESLTRLAVDRDESC
jgi:D-threo-aldose 1-dehydrogenase